MVDKNLFLYDLAVVAILKNEGHYLKEWLDYHLLAGVNHFYLYDNDSTDNQAEVVAPYVEAGLVDYFRASGDVMQYVAYNDAVKRFKFHCRYMAIIDGDEFIYPKSRGGGVIDVVDEILSRVPNAAGLAVHWQSFGSNGHKKADYSRGVLERFTRRAPTDSKINKLIKTISDPRRIDYVYNAHVPAYFVPYVAIEETGKETPNELPITADKIAMNHYFTKSFEEYAEKVTRGKADLFEKRNLNEFNARDYNEEFDDGILKYREERAKIHQPPDNSHVNERLLTALIKNLLPTLKPTEPNFYAGKMETFLTCRAVSSYLKTKLIDAKPAKFFEEASLVAILRSVNGMSFTDARMFLRELPQLLKFEYPVVKNLRKAALMVIPGLMRAIQNLVGKTKHFHLYRNYVELDYLQDILKSGG